MSVRVMKIFLYYFCSSVFYNLGALKWWRNCMSAHNFSHLVHNKPSLSAWPSPVVVLGQRVNLLCDSHRQSGMFKLYKELGDPIPQVYENIFWKSILLGPVTSAHGGTYRCYNYNHGCTSELSSHSDPLKIIISGIYRKPFLVVPHTPLVNSGEKLSLECHSEIMFDTFILTSQRKGIIKESFQHFAESHFGWSHANFSIRPVTPDHAGTYECYGSYNHTPYEWSESSDPVDIVITGLYKKPSLAALMGPVVMSEENMTLACISDHQFDMFHLSREGVPHGHGQPAVQSHNGAFQANFFLGPVIQKGNYRCYGFFRNSLHVWSSPSDPLYLSVTDNHKNQNVVIGLSVAMIPVSLIVLLCSCFSAKKTNIDQDPKVRTTLNRQDPEREDVQEVTYLEIEKRNFKQKLTTPISQIPKKCSTDLSVYVEIRK
ncbi:Kir3dl1 [Phodopus roborovskii]|uniref:Kir3dl1 protein n=1 Tax=Phodopus roborovskii TaxID=109678 RepID=A0AAV0A8L8_PHORO|nr:Kir3dl1 [Phodopus roborovskii]